MKKFILLNLAVIAMMSSAHADLAGYQKVEKAENIERLRSAINIALSESDQRFTGFIGGECYTILRASSTDFYVESKLEQPLVIAQYEGSGHVFRVVIETDSGRKSIISMKYLQFKLENVETNKTGTLAELDADGKIVLPEIVVTPTWKSSLPRNCLSK